MRKAKVSANRPLTMGICGITHNVGVTLVSLAASNYLTGVKNYKVACIEMTGKSIFSQISRQAKSKPFRQLGIDFYPSTTLLDYTHILSQAYDMVVIDFGILNRGTFDLYLNCNVRVVLGYIGPWNRETYYEWILSHLDLFNKKEIVYMGNLGSDTDVKAFYHQSGIRPIPVPCLENPFHLTSGQYEFIERALENVDIPRQTFYPEMVSHEFRKQQMV